MKSKLVIGCLLATAGTFGYAQTSNVTIDGTIDAGVEYVTNVGAAGDGLTRVPSLTGTASSRFGFRGSEDLGGGLNAVFTLENGFTPDAGGFGQGGRLFGRQGFVGLSGSWGAVTVGRQYTMLFWSLLKSDVLGPMSTARARSTAIFRTRALTIRSHIAAHSMGFPLARPTA